MADARYLHRLTQHLPAGFGDLQATLSPRQMALIETAESKSLYLQCSDNAEHLAIVDTAKFVVAGTAKLRNMTVPRTASPH